MEDVREKASLDHQAVVSLNFIQDSAIYLFRRHYRQGLRSHIMEVLKRMDVARERTGIEINGVIWFPRAKPTRMLRIFRTKFKRLEEANVSRPSERLHQSLAPCPMAETHPLRDAPLPAILHRGIIDLAAKDAPAR